MGTETRASRGTDGGGVDQQYPEQGVTRFQQTSFVRGLVGTGEHSGSSSSSFINNTGEHSWRTKSDKVLPSLRPIDLSPGRYNEPRRSASRSHPSLKRISEESGDTMSEPDDFREGSSSAKPQYYGSTAFGFSEDDDDDEFLLDEELARDGLYRGNYRSLLWLYTVVPLTTLLSFISLALVPTLVLPSQTPSLFPYPPYLPFPILEALTAAALWSLSYLLRDFLYATTLSLPSSPIITITLSATLQTIFNLFFRQLAIPILLIPYYSSKHDDLGWQDDAFRRAWWVALGWAAVEAIVGVKQGYESIALYKDVLVSVNTSTSNTEMGSRGRSGQDESRDTYPIDAINQPETPRKKNGHDGEDVDATPRQMNWEPQRHGGLDIQRTGYLRSPSTGSKPAENLPSTSNERQPLLEPLIQRSDDQSRLRAENEVERDLDQLIALKNREELEEVYGMPVIRIPVFLSCLHRINSILSSLGICLLLTAAYMQSTFAIPTPPSPLPTLYHPVISTSNRPLGLTVPPIIVIYTILATMHTPLILPRIGIHTFVYIELLVSLGVFFAGLGVWHALN